MLLYYALVGIWLTALAICVWLYRKQRDDDDIPPPSACVGV